MAASHLRAQPTLAPPSRASTREAFASVWGTPQGFTAPGPTAGFATPPPQEAPLTGTCLALLAPAQGLEFLAVGCAEGSAQAAELRALVAKLACVEAAVASPAGATAKALLGGGATGLPFDPAHDLLPPQEVVARCAVRGFRPAEVEGAVRSLCERGSALLQALRPQDREAAAALLAQCHRTSEAVALHCSGGRRSEGDVPAGPRDEAYAKGTYGGADVDGGA